LRIQDCRYIAGATTRSEYPASSLPEVVFLGRSNVGKSSLINSLTGTRLARVSGTPGRTQRAHFYEVGRRVLFVDLPGYGYAKVPARMRGALLEIIETYLNAGRPLALAALVVDARHAPSDQDCTMNEWLAGRGLPVRIVSNKVDKLSRAERSASLAQSRRLLGREDIIPFSSETGEGVGGLWQAIDSSIVRLKD
jgi:GTP-binding protein